MLLVGVYITEQIQKKCILQFFVSFGCHILFHPAGGSASIRFIGLIGGHALVYSKDDLIPEGHNEYDE